MMEVVVNAIIVKRRLFYNAEHELWSFGRLYEVQGGVLVLFDLGLSWNALEAWSRENTRKCRPEFRRVLILVKTGLTGA
jgi:hypothetical protein